MDKEEYKRQSEQRDKKDNANSFRERWFGWWKTPSDRFAALIALFTAVLAFVAWQQLRAMRSTDEAIHRQLTIMQGQLDAMIRDQQPYISATENILPPVIQFVPPGSTTGWISWNIPVINSGKGAARNVTANTFMSLDYGPFRRSNPFARPEPVQFGEMGAGKGGWFTIASQAIVNQIQFDGLKAKELAISVLIEFTYSDSLGKTYENSLCYGLYTSGAITFMSIPDCKKKKE